MIKLRRMRWIGHLARIGNAYRILVGKPEGKRPLGRPRRRWMDNSKMDLRGIRCGVMDWFDLSQDRDKWRALVNAVMNFRMEKSIGKFLCRCAIGGFSRRAFPRGVSQ
jgi:hypothetical protein